jgi:TonB family protein
MNEIMRTVGPPVGGPMGLPPSEKPLMPAVYSYILNKDESTAGHACRKGNVLVGASNCRPGNYRKRCRRMAWSILLVASLGVCSSAVGGGAKPGYLRIKTFPPGGLIKIADSVVSDFEKKKEWLEVKRPEGTYHVSAIGLGNTILFDVSIISRKKTYATVDLVSGKVEGNPEESHEPSEIASRVITNRPSVVSPSGESSDSLPRWGEFVAVETMPEITKEVRAEYPRQAKSAGIEGTVWIAALIDKRGVVLNTIVTKSSGNLSLDEAALRAAKRCKYKPGIQNGEPVACWVKYPVMYVLVER